MTELDKIVAEIRHNIPPFVVDGEPNHAVWRGVGAMFKYVRLWQQDLLAKLAFRSHSTGMWLALIGQGQKMAMLPGETEAQYQVRLGQIANAITAPLIKAGVDAILAPHTSIKCKILQQHRDGWFWDTKRNNATANKLHSFWSRGGRSGNYFWSRGNQRFTVLIPRLFGTRNDMFWDTKTNNTVANKRTFFWDTKANNTVANKRDAFFDSATGEQYSVYNQVLAFVRIAKAGGIQAKVRVDPDLK